MADSRSARPAPVVELVRSILGVIAIAVLVGTTLSVVAKGPPSAAATSLSWSNVTPPATSPPDVGGVTVYDPATDQLLLVQANGGTQTWAWNGTVWTSMAKMPNPDDEYVTTPMLIAYDSATSQLVLADDDSPDLVTRAADLTAVAIEPALAQRVGQRGEVLVAIDVELQHLERREREPS